MTPVLGKGLTGQETYQALLRLYTIALQQAIDAQEGNFSWVSLCTLWLVLFTTLKPGSHVRRKCKRKRKETHVRTGPMQMQTQAQMHKCKRKE